MNRSASRIALFANTDWYLYNFRLPLAAALRDSGTEVILMSPSGQYHDRLIEAGFRWIEIPMSRRSANPLHALWTLFRLWTTFRKEKPDILHCFTVQCVVLGSAAAALAGVRRRVNALAGLGFVFSSDSLLARVLRPALRVALKLALSGTQSRVILQNHDDENVLIRQRIITPSRCRVIRGSGVNLSRFTPNPDRPAAPIRVLLASRLLWSKGIQDYYDAARMLSTCDGRVEFLLAGEPDPGNPDSVSRDTIEEWRRTGTIKPLGHVNDMAELMKQVHIVVLPTTYGEGVPRTLLEAAASGLPIVASDSPGCREIVIPERNGLLVPARDPQKLADAVRRLIESPEMMESYGKEGRAIAIAEFDERLVIARTRAVYQELHSTTAINAAG